MTRSIVCMAVLGFGAPLCVRAQAVPAPSGLAGYQAYADAPVVPWRESNDRVRQVGGWRAYARQAQAAAAPIPDAPTLGAPSGAALPQAVPPALPQETKP